MLESLDTYRAAEKRYAHTQIALSVMLGMTTLEEVEAKLTRNLEQGLAGQRVVALSPDRVVYAPGSPDKRAARELGRRLESGKRFTPRQLDLAAYLAWRYRRQIDASLVPFASVIKP